MLVSFLRGFNHLPKMNTFIVEDPNSKTFAVRDKYVENSRPSLTHICTHSYSYLKLSNRTYLEMIATHTQVYSPAKMGSRYHAFVLTSEYPTPTSYICKRGNHFHLIIHEVRKMTKTNIRVFAQSSSMYSCLLAVQIL